jgi:hypothetical protein
MPSDEGKPWEIWENHGKINDANHGILKEYLGY